MHSDGVDHIFFLFEYCFLVSSFWLDLAFVFISQRCYFFSFVFVCLMFLFGYNYGGIMLILHMLYSGFGKGLYMVFMKRCYRQISCFD